MTNDDDNHRYQFVFDLANGTIIADSKSPKGPKLAMQSLPDLARIAQPGDALVHEIDNAPPHDGIETTKIAERPIGIPNLTESESRT